MKFTSLFNPAHFQPKLLTALKNYDRAQFQKDLTAGLIVGVVALPLSIAIAIASGVTPERGLFTAIVAGFLISALGGSRVQVGGPTGAFIVIVYGIVQEYGVDGLVVATFLAGLMLIVMGFAGLGSVIKFIPYPLEVGFTAGIALVIFSSQVKDFFGIEMGAVPSGFLEKWEAYAAHFKSVNFYALGMAAATAGLTFWFQRKAFKIPGSLVALILITLLVHFFHLPVETIQSRFGDIPSDLPTPVLPSITWVTFQKLIEPAFTIALLCGIESLLSAMVADGMISGNHRSNTELVAQGIANVGSALFGGIPATGAIARTATNVKNGGRTPVAGMVHAVVLLIIVLFVGRWAKLIPLACLAGILVVVCYNMSQWRSFRAILRGQWDDMAILLSTFLLTVFIDLTVAIEIGMVLAAFVFMRRMAAISDISMVTGQLNDLPDSEDTNGAAKLEIPHDVDVYQINGPLFFGVAHKFKEAVRGIERKPRVVILRMRQVPMIDASGLHNFREFAKNTRARGIGLMLSGVQPAVQKVLEEAGLLKWVGEENIFPNIGEALKEATFAKTLPLNF